MEAFEMGATYAVGAPKEGIYMDDPQVLERRYRIPRCVTLSLGDPAMEALDELRRVTRESRSEIVRRLIVAEQARRELYHRYSTQAGTTSNVQEG